MVLLHSEMVKLGTKAHDFSLKGIDGITHSLQGFAHFRVLVIIFMCNHCPYVQAVWPRLNELQKKYNGKGIQLVGINPNVGNPIFPQDNFEEMKRAPERFGLNFPYLTDEKQTVAKKYHAVCTPDIFVYNAKHELVYRGRVDDNWEEPEKITTHDLEDAIKALLKGKKIAEVQHPSMGCSIKWLE